MLFPEPTHPRAGARSSQSFDITRLADWKTPVEGDASTSNTDNLLPPYNAFSTDGEVEAELVFVNYGTPADYELLRAVRRKRGRQDRHLKVRGILARHQTQARRRDGSSWHSDLFRPGRRRLWAEAMCTPKGPTRTIAACSAARLWTCPPTQGDVLTPGVGATGDVKPTESATKRRQLHRFLCCPISYRDALPLLEAMGGAVVPEGMARRLADHLPPWDPGPARVRLKLRVRLEDGDGLQRHRPPGRREHAGSDGLFEAIITDGWNHGAAGPAIGDSRHARGGEGGKPPRRIGLPAGNAASSTRPGMPKSPGTDRIDRVGGASRSQSCRSMRLPTSIRTATDAGS